MVTTAQLASIRKHYQNQLPKWLRCVIRRWPVHAGSDHIIYKAIARQYSKNSSLIHSTSQRTTHIRFPIYTAVLSIWEKSSVPSGWVLITPGWISLCPDVGRSARPWIDDAENPVIRRSIRDFVSAIRFPSGKSGHPGIVKAFRQRVIDYADLPWSISIIWFHASQVLEGERQTYRNRQTETDRQTAEQR